MSVTLKTFGEYLGVRGQELVVTKDNEVLDRVPFHKVRRAVISSGNFLSSSALFWLATYGVETAIVSKTGKLVATIVPTGWEARGDTRLKQYKAYFNRKGVEIARGLVERRVESVISVMENHDLDISKIEGRLPMPDFGGERIEDVRYNICGFEARSIKHYFKQYFGQLPDWLRPSRRTTRNAVEPFNNLLNLGYEVLRRRVHIAIIQAHLDPYIGYLHSTRQYQQALVYDMMEPWRAMIEDFILNYHPKLDPDSFTLHGKRSFLKQQPMHQFTKTLDKHIDNKRTPYNYRDNSKTTRIRTAIKEDPKKLAINLRRARAKER